MYLARQDGISVLFRVRKERQSGIENVDVDVDVGVEAERRASVSCSYQSRSCVSSGAGAEVIRRCGWSV